MLYANAKGKKVKQDIRFKVVAACAFFLTLVVLLPVLLSSYGLASKAQTNQVKEAKTVEYQYPFQNPDLPIEQRVDNIISLMTLDEKVACLGTNPSVPRLGIKASGHLEGIHGLAMGGPAKWGRGTPVPTTIFPQGIGLAETWDTDCPPDRARQGLAHAKGRRMAVRPRPGGFFNYN